MKRYTLFLFFGYILISNLLAQNSSVLSSGDWYKLATNQNGIYKIDYSDVEALGIDVSSLNNSSIKLYGNGRGMLPELNSSFRYTDLVQNSIQIYDLNNNGFFESGDYILFYGHSPDVWRFNESTGLFEHEINAFTDKVNYFLTIDSQSEENRVSQKPILQEATKVITSFYDFDFHENNLENLIQSGREWFGERFTPGDNQFFEFSFPNLDVTSPINIKTSVVARSLTPSVFNIQTNSNNINTISIDNVVTTYATEYAKMASGTADYNSSSPDIMLSINYNSSDNGALAWLNYIEINAKRELRMSDNSLLFRDVSLLPNQIGNYVLTNVTSDISVWDVSDHTNVRELFTNIESSVLSFNDSIDKIYEYIAFNSNAYLNPDFEGLVENQDLHNISLDVEYIIVSHPDFLNAADRLAQFHENRGNLKSVVVTPQQVYNEFSSGVQDVSAIRDFVRMLYKRPSSKIKYLLLFGDGSYDPKDRVLENTNYIPTYQSINSTHPIYSYVTDDYFGLLDDNEGLFNNDELDIGIGRFPVSTLDDANNLVDKVERYYDKEAFGSWRNNVVFVADDGDSNDGNTHMWQADSLANYIADKYRDVNIQKVYLDNYLQESTTAGPRSQDAQYAINNRIEKGALLINYTGHGSPLGWTKERILELDQINSWENSNKLPLFMTATCKFSYFDNPEELSAGEQVLLNPDGGAIGLLSTTRLVYSPPNYNLNSKFIRTLFNKENGSFLRLGDVFKKTKNLSGTSTNNRNFILLGDPALILAYPEYDIETTSIEDTLKALGEFTIEGQIENAGELASNFNGIVYPIVYDKEIVKTTLGQESCTPMPYRDQNNILYKGAATVNEGKFSFSFVVPKDIAYNYGPGKISYYAVDDNELMPIDANGSVGVNDSGFVDFVIGGTASNINYDYEGADLDLFMNTRNFINGGVTDRNPVLLVDVIDESGINTVGNGIGHDITATIDGNMSNVYVLNDFYEAALDDYKRGIISFPLYDLEEGAHTITVKVWDVFNNSSEKEIGFLVVDNDELVISDFNCYPNPFTNSTEIYFQHNKTGQILDYVLDIYSITGVLIKRIGESVHNNSGYTIGPISWNGKDRAGDKLSPGIYFLNLTARLEEGGFASKSTRVILLPK